MENRFEKLKTTTIKDFRIKFFEQFENNTELIKEFSKFTNLNNSMSLYDDFIKYSIKILQQRIFDEQKIGKRVGNINILKARLKQAEVNLEKYLKEIKSKENKEQFTEIGFVEWVASVSKYYGFEIKGETTMFDFLVMAKKMNKDIDLQQKELDKFKKRK